MCIRDSDGTVLADGTISEDVLSGTVASVLGIQTLQMGVFGGIIVGLGVAALHNKYYKITLPNALSFFGGSRFVPIISTLVYVGVGILLFFVWPFVQNLSLIHIFRPWRKTTESADAPMSRFSICRRS